MRAILAISALITCVANTSSTYAAVPAGSLKQQEYRSLLAEVGYKTAPADNTETKKLATKVVEQEAQTKAEIDRLTAENKALKEFLISMRESSEAENKETLAELAKIRAENKKRDKEFREKLVALAEKEKAVEARQDQLEKVVVTQPESSKDSRPEESVPQKAESADKTVSAERKKIETEYAEKEKASEEREKQFLDKQRKDMRQKLELAVAELKQQLTSSYEKRIKEEVSKARSEERKKCSDVIVPNAVKSVAKKEQLVKKQTEEKERAQIADQKSKGMVTYGMFKSVRKENECVSRYRLHFWKCKAKNGDKNEATQCWQKLYKEFRNCLKVTVPEGRAYSEESKGILGKEKDHVQ